MDKRYQPQEFEEKIYQLWEKSGAFSPKDKGEPFCIIMPPPNANDPLHVGHAMFVTVEDILIRFERMRGKAAFWLPGTDHAGIETQYVFEKKLQKKGKSRFDYDRETLYQMIWDYVQENSEVAINQMKRIGASADWSQKKFTLDKDVVEKVLETFIKMYKEGLVYRDLQLVNYCTKCGTAFSNLEIEHKEEKNKLYYVKYQLADSEEKITVATTRPETIYADIAIAINPKHKLAKKLNGKRVINPLTQTEMLIIEDKAVDLEFGTGLLKITPFHDKTDWEIWKRHEKELSEPISVIDQEGKMTEAAGELAGMKVMAAREKVVEKLEIEKIKTDYVNKVSKCYRCNKTIEPLPLPQFFIKVGPLVEPVLKALKEKKTVVYGNGHDKILKHWLENLEDWNISRQIVWGIQMPVWYCGPTSLKVVLGGKDINACYMVSKKRPKKCDRCGATTFKQETDTFDTWFSSSQWPEVTLKTTKPGNFERFYPTNVMETAYDILVFWVMRMMLMGMYLTKNKKNPDGIMPFKKVYLHGLIRDAKGQKMSKSKGNVLNPLEVVDKYGADALRMALVMSTTPGRDKAVGEETIRGMRNLTNKIWNAARYVILNYEKPKEGNYGDSVQDQAFYKQLKDISSAVTRQLDSLKPGLAAETVYNEFWHWFCDHCIEDAKRGQLSWRALKQGLITFLKLLHPFVPFVTEAVWRELADNKEKLLIEAEWPKN